MGLGGRKGERSEEVASGSSASERGSLSNTPLSTHHFDYRRRRPPRGVDWPQPDIGLMFINVGQGEGEETDGVSRYNIEEAKVVLDVVKGLLMAGEVGIDDVGIITPYRAQVRVLRGYFREIVEQGRRRWEELWYYKER